jgi:hypothetical protein
VSRRSPIKISRRRLLAASGATLAASAPVALAACGDTEEDDEDVSPARQAELLNAILAQQLAVSEAAGHVSGNAPADAAAIAAALRNLRDRSEQELESTIEDLDGTPTTDAVGLAGGESPTEGLARQLETSIAATLQAIGELPPERRQPIQQAITDDAAALAGLRSVLGEEIAPDAFVMGPPSSEDS